MSNIGLFCEDEGTQLTIKKPIKIKILYNFRIIRIFLTFLHRPFRKLLFSMINFWKKYYTFFQIAKNLILSMMTFGKDLRLNLVWVCQTQTVYLRVKYLKSCGTILSFVVSFLKCINFDRDTQDEKITPVETDLKASLN